MLNEESLILIADQAFSVTCRLHQYKPSSTSKHSYQAEIKDVIKECKQMDWMVCCFPDNLENLSNNESCAFSPLKDNAIITWFLTLGWQGSEETILKCLTIPPAFLIPEEQGNLAHEK